MFWRLFKLFTKTLAFGSIFQGASAQYKSPFERENGEFVVQHENPDDDSCNEFKLQTITFNPGVVTLPYKGVLSVYPYQDEVEPGTYLDERDPKAYLDAITWLKGEPLVKNLSGNQFTTMLKTLHAKILPNEASYRTMGVFLRRYDISLFEDTKELNDFLSDKEKSTLMSIKRKIASLFMSNQQYKEYLSNLFTDPEFEESIARKMVEKGYILIVNENGDTLLKIPSIPELYQFSKNEKDLIKKFYDVMEECPEEVIDNRLVTGFDRIVQAYKNDPVELAAQIHMLIVDIHPFLDGNGRTARTFLNSILQSAGLPMAVFPHKKEYKDIVQEARDKKDYSIFGKYVNELTSENKYGELKEVCKYLHENNCHKLESQPKPRKGYEICFNYMLKKQQEAEHSKHLKAYRQDKGTRLREVRKKK